MHHPSQHAAMQWLRQQKHFAQHCFKKLHLLALFSALCIAAQGWIVADLLQQLIIYHRDRMAILAHLVTVGSIALLRAGILYLRTKISFHAGQTIRQHVRQQLFDQLMGLGPIGSNDHPLGSWVTMLCEQVENLHDYFARYLPQQFLAMVTPTTILLFLFPVNWVASLLLLFTAPLIPLFMVLVGLSATEANRRNWTALSRLNNHFLDRLQALESLRLFDQTQQALTTVAKATNLLRTHTLEVVRLAFLSSAVLEFFSAIAIALVAIYFGFSYLGIWKFGHYGTAITLFSGFLVLILSPEFYQPLRDLGTFYHAKAQAVSAAQFLLEAVQLQITSFSTQQKSVPPGAITLEANGLEIDSPQGERLVGPLNFTVPPGSRVVLIGPSGSGKSTLIHLLLGFLPYRGSCTINGVELRELDLHHWRAQLSWVGQNPQLLPGTLLDNITLADPTATPSAVERAVQWAYVDQFLSELPHGLLTNISETAIELSVGQAQRVAVARALLRPCKLLLLDEPTASLDSESEQLVAQTLAHASQRQTTITITHRQTEWQSSDQIWVLKNGVVQQQGSYAQLSRQPGPLATLLTQQHAAQQTLCDR